VTTSASPGDIIITEFFADTAGPDDNKSGSKSYNTTDHDIDITGWTIADNDTDNHTIGGTSPVIVRTKGYLVSGQLDFDVGQWWHAGGLRLWDRFHPGQQRG